MKKSLFKIISVLFISTMIFVSCSNFFDSEKSVDGGYQISGTVSPYDFAETLPARTAFPTLPASATIFYYTVTATLGGKTVIDDVEGINGAQFNLKIPSAGEWSVTASCFGDSARQNLLYKTTTPTVIKVSNDSPSKFANLTLKPLMTAGKTGTLNLEIDGSGLDEASFHPSEIQVECISGNLPDMNDRISASFDDGTKIYALKTNDGQSLPSGSYTFNINFFNRSKNLYFYSVTETVNIYDDLETNRWVKNGDEEYITAAGKFVLTDAIVNKFQQESIYVDSSATSDNASGTWIDPYKTLDAAIDRLKANPSIKTIFVSGNHTISKNLNFSNGGNVTHDLTIKKNPRASTKPVVTTTTKESFIVGGPHKIVIENIDFTGCGNNDGASPTGTNSDTNTKAGAFLYFQASTGSAEITNCTISDYYSDKGGAICAGASSTTTLTNVDITGCKAQNGGAISVYGNVTYVSGSITECSATQNGGAIRIFKNSTNNSKISLTDITIANCKTGNENSAAIDIEAEATKAELKISGKNIIAENYYGDTETKKNVRLETAARRIIIAGDIAGSKIGVSHDEGVFTATIGNPATFTTGFTNCTASAGSVFFDDSGKTGISVNPEDNEAALTYSGGTLSDIFTDMNIKFDTSVRSFFPGIAKTIYITPYLYLNGSNTREPYTNRIWNSIQYETWITCDGVLIEGTTTKNTLKAATEESGRCPIPVNIPATIIYEDNYIMHVKTTYTVDGYAPRSFDAFFSLKGEKDAKDLAGVPPAGTTVKVSSKDGIKKIADLVNSGHNLAGINFVQSMDITSAGDWTPIGNESNYFSGSFDGNGKKITDAKISAGGSGSCKGLFGSTRNATIKNIKLEDSTISTSNNYNSGSIIGNMLGGILENCTVSRISLTSNGTTSTGGLVGSASSGAVIKNCDVYDSSIGGRSGTGGVVGTVGSGCKVINCSYARTSPGNFSVSIYRSQGSGETGMGGIAGKNEGLIINCYNSGKLFTSDSLRQVGGIAGINEAGGKILNCCNIGFVDGANTVGGIAGLNKGEISNCVSASCLKTNGTKVANIAGINDSGTIKDNYYLLNFSNKTAYYEDNSAIPANYVDATGFSYDDGLIENEKTIGTTTTKNVADLMNAWISVQPNKDEYGQWELETQYIVVAINGTLSSQMNIPFFKE